MIIQSKKIWIADQFVPAQVEMDGGKIVGIGPYGAKPVDQDYGDKRIVPGFIDIHSHSDGAILDCPTAESRILQGVTTEIGGDCGLGVAPVSQDPENKKQLIAFSLVSTMQAAFLSGENSKQITGYNLFEKTERDMFVSDTVSMLMEGIYE